ncbi:DUF4347 domain-containing protein, partial [Pontibacterium sp. N1Y112]
MMKKQDETAVSGVLARKPLFRALEQRIMFDAAAVDTAAQAAAPEVIINATDTQDDALLDNLAALVPPAERDRTNLVVVDQGVESYDTLLQQIPDNYSVLVIPAGENGLARLAESLQNFNDLESIHILSHGSDNLFQLGADKLTAETVNQHADALAKIGNALNADGDLLLYGCNLSASTDGQSLLASIAALTGADVAASDDLTGAETLGGDWQLESRTGDIEASILELTYDGLLTGATYVTTTSPDLDRVHTEGNDPIDFQIDVGELPTDVSSIHLAIHANDIDEEQGELDKVYLNGTELGRLTGANGVWSTTTFEVNSGLVRNGANDIQITINSAKEGLNPWQAQVDWGQILINGGAKEHGAFSEAKLSAVVINESTANFTSALDLNISTSGSYRLETQLSDKDTGNVVSVETTTFTGTAGQNQQLAIDSSYLVSEPTGVCVMSFNLFYTGGGTDVLQAQTAYEFDTVENKGPSTAPDSADNTVSFNGAGEYVFEVNDFSFTDIDGDTLDAVVLKSLPSPGELTFNGSTVTSLISVTQADIIAGKLKYTAAENGFGPAYSNFSFKVSDGSKESAAYTFTFNVEEPIYIRSSNSALNQSDGQNTQVALLTPYTEADGATYTYSLVAGTGDTHNDLFNVVDNQLIVNDAGLIAQGSLSLRLQVEASGTEIYTRTQVVTLTLSDDVAPTSIQDTVNTDNFGSGADMIHGSVAEGATAGTEVGIDIDASDIADITYSLQGVSSNLFEIDPSTGVIAVASGALVNFEASEVHSLTVVATDAHSNAATFSVRIAVTNVAPQLVDDTGTATERASNVTGNVLTNDIDPGSAAGADLNVVSISGDSTKVGQAVAGSHGGLFTITTDGSWRFNANGDFDTLLDDETQTTRVTLRVEDSSGEGGETTLEVTVSGITAEAPELALENTDVDQSLRRNSMVARLSVPNALSGQRYGYTLVDGDGSDSNDLFTLESRGYLRIQNDAAGLPLGDITVRVRAALTSGDEAGLYTIEQVVTLSVVDTVAPKFSGDSDSIGDGSGVNGRFVMGMANGDKVGITVKMDRADQENVTFSLSTGGDCFQIDETTGVVTVRDVSLISASDSSYTITVVATDPAGNTATRDYNISIEVDTVAPEFNGDSDRMGNSGSFSGRVIPGMAAGEEVGITVQMDRDDQGAVKFSLSGGGDRFQIDADTGVVSVKDAGLISASDSSYTITVVATDMGGNTASQDYLISVEISARDDTARGNQGYTLSGDVLRNDRDVGGDNSAMTVAQVAGSAENLGQPVAGSQGGVFTINGDGSWTFDPTAELNKIRQNESLNTTIDVTVLDSMGQLSTSTLTITVLGRNDAPTNLQLSSPEYTLSSVNRVVGDLTVDDVDEGDTPTIKVSRDNSSSFEVVDNQLLVKEGVSLAPGSYTLTLEARDSGRARVIEEFTIVIADDGAPTFATPADSDSAGNESETIQGVVHDGATEGTVGITASATDSSQISYSLTDDASGRFVIDGASGVISVKQGATILLSDAFYDVMVRATDVYNNSADQAFRIAVKDAPPVAVDDVDVTVEDNTSPVTGQVLSNDDNPGETREQLRVRAVNGSVDNLDTAIAGSHGGLFTVQADGTWSFSPDAAFNAMQVGDSLETSVTVEISDSRGSTAESRLTVTVNGENDVPTAIMLTGTTVALDSDNLVLGDLSATDPDTGDSHSFTLVEKESDAADNRFFRINGTELELVDKAIGTGNKTVHIQVSDTNGLAYIQSFTLRVTDTAVLTITGDSDAAHDATDGSYNGLVKEGAAAGSAVGIQVQVDYLLDENPTINYSLLEDADNRFVIDQSGVIAVAENAVFDAAGISTHTVIVQAEVGGDVATSSFVIGVVPTLSVADDTAEVIAGYSAFDLNVLDNDPSKNQLGGPLTVLAVNDQNDNVGQGVDGNNGGHFVVSGDGLWQFTSSNEFEDLNVGESRVTSVDITVSNAVGDTATSTLNVTVTGEADAPTDLKLDKDYVDIAAGSPLVGTLTGIDVDSEQDELTFSLAESAENPDNALFEIDGDQLQVKGAATLTVGTVYRLYIEVSDGTGSMGKVFNVTAIDPAVPYITGDRDAAFDDKAKSIQGSVVEGDYSSETGVGITVNSIFNGELTYTLYQSISIPFDGLSAEHEHELFSIDADGVIRVKAGATLNAEAGTTQFVVVKATDKNNPDNSAYRTFDIEVRNLAPTINDDTHTVSNQATVLKGNIRDNDSDPGSTNLSDDLYIGFGVETLKLHEPTAGSDGGAFSINRQGEWTFRLGDDFNDLQPGESRVTTARVLTKENIFPGQPEPVESILSVTVVAPDDISLNNNRLDLAQSDNAVGNLSSIAGGDGLFSFELVDGAGDTANNRFSIDGNTLNVIREPLPAPGEYSIRVRMSGGETPPVETMLTVVLLNTDVEFSLIDIDSSPSTGTVTEGDVHGTEVELRVQPNQPSRTLTYALTDTADGRFMIDPQTGVVTVDDASKINAEDGTSEYQIQVTATEEGSGRSSLHTFNISLENANLQASNDQANVLANATSPFNGNVFSNDQDPNSVLPGSDVIVLGAGPEFDSLRGQSDLYIWDIVPQFNNGIDSALSGSEGGRFLVKADGSWTFEHNGEFADLSPGETKETRITVLVADIGFAWGVGLPDSAKDRLPAYLNGDLPGTPVATEIIVTVTGTLNTQDFQLVDKDSAHNDRGSNPHGYGAITEGAANGALVGITVGATDSRQPLTFDMTDDAGGRFDIDTSSGEISVKNGALLNAEDGANHYQVRVTATEANTGLISTDTFIIFLDNATLNAADDHGQTNANATTPLSGNVFSNDSDANSTLLGDDVVVWAAGSSVESISSSPELTLSDASRIGGDGIDQSISGSNGGLFRVDHNGNWTFTHNGDFDDLAVGVTRETRISVLVSDQGLEWGEDRIIADTMPDFIDSKPGQPVVSEIIITVVGMDDTVAFELTDTDSTQNNRGSNPSGYGAVNENAADNSLVGITVVPTTPRQALTFELTDSADGRFTIDENGVIRVVEGARINAESGVDHYNVVVVAREAETGKTGIQTFTIFVDNTPLTALDDTGHTTENAASPITGNVFTNDSDPNSVLPGNDVVVLAAGPDVNALRGQSELSISGIRDHIGQGLNTAVTGSNGGIFRITADGNWQFETNGDFTALTQGQTTTSSLTVVSSDHGLGLGANTVDDGLPAFINGKPGTPVVTEIVVTIVGENATPVVTPPAPTPPAPTPPAPTPPAPTPPAPTPTDPTPTDPAPTNPTPTDPTPTDPTPTDPTPTDPTPTDPTPTDPTPTDPTPTDPTPTDPTPTDPTPTDPTPTDPAPTDP